MKKERCILCGQPLEKYPNSGEPLVSDRVCVRCNNEVVVPYRYFAATCKGNRCALLVRNGRLRIVETSDGKFKQEDLDLYLGEGAKLRQSQIPGISLAFPKHYDQVGDTVRTAVLKALKRIELSEVMVIPDNALERKEKNKCSR